MLDQLLIKIGLDRKEAIVYLTCFSLGTQRASLIAKKCGLKRSSTHLILERLAEKGFVSSHTEENNVQFFTAIAPEKLIQKLEEEQNEIETNKKHLEASLNDFHKLLHPYNVQPKVSFFNGVEGIKRVMEDTLTSKGEILCYSNIEAWFKNEILKHYIITYGKNRIRKKKIPLRAIDTDLPDARQYLEKEYPKGEELTQIRWLPKNILGFTNEINIFDDKVAICSLAENELLGIIIESESIAKTQKSIFELAWNSAIKSKP